jgi:RNA polymerase sigma-70 factor (ECF subfamily)
LREIAELVSDALAGDRSAFACLLERETPSAYRAALAILRSPEEARDVVQEASVRAWQELPRLRRADAWPAWFRRITVRQALDERRHARHTRESQSIADAWLDAADPTVNIDETITLLAGFSRLRPEDRAILALRFHLDLTVPDVAEALGMRVGTAKARIHRAIARLRAELRDDNA